MTALIGMRLFAFTRTGRALAPLVGVLVVLSILYGGGKAQAGEAYGVSAAILFGVLAWQTKILLDVEPDVQRRLARVAVGGADRELVAGIGAAFIAALPMIVIALVLPWLLGGVTTPQTADDPPLSEGIALGIWAHLLLLVPAIALGALASRGRVRRLPATASQSRLIRPIWRRRSASRTVGAEVPPKTAGQVRFTGR